MAGGADTFLPCLFGLLCFALHPAAGLPHLWLQNPPPTPIYFFIGLLRRVPFCNEWCVMTRLSASELPLWCRPFVSERLRLSLRFWKQSITNPGCQCANVFLNTWKLRSSVRFSKAALPKIEKRTFTIPLSICQLLCNIMCLKNKMKLNRTTCGPSAPCK